MDGESVGGAGGLGGGGGIGGAGEARGIGGAGETNAIGAGDRADVAKAAASAKVDAVDAQADAVAGPAKAEDGFERAEAVAQPETKRTTPSEGTLAEVARREAQTINAIADRLAANSPTASRILSDFRAAGGRFELGLRGGYFSQRGTPTIGVRPGSEQDRMQSMAHELGHFDFRANLAGAYVAPGRPPGLTDHQIEMRREHNFIVDNAQRQLLNEGHATVINNAVRNEYRAATGIDIGVSGDSAQRPLPLDNAQPIEVQRQAIADFYARHLTTGITGQNYREYYNQFYIGVYRDNFLPGGPAR